MSAIDGAEWSVAMDTSVLLCYFDYLGYRVASGQCDNGRIEAFRELVKGKRKIMLEECRTQLDILFHWSFPDYFSGRNKKTRTAKKHLILDGDRDPVQMLDDIEDACVEDFEPCKCEDRVRNSETKRVRDGILDYMRTRYTNNPLGKESLEWIYRKRHSIPTSISPKLYGTKDAANREKLRYLVKKMRKAKDLDMLVKILLFVKRMDEHVLFVSEDYDHMVPKDILLKDSGGRLHVMSVKDMIKGRSEFPLKAQA